MIKRIILASTVVLICSCFGLISFAQGEPATMNTTAEITVAAKKFLATLDDAQRARAVYDFKDNAQRKRWSNLPTSFVKRGGLRMGDLTKPQREAAMALLAAALSPRGYEKVTQIVEGDEMLKKMTKVVLVVLVVEADLVNPAAVAAVRADQRCSATMSITYRCSDNRRRLSRG